MSVCDPITAARVVHRAPVEFHPGYRVFDDGRVESFRKGEWRDLKYYRRGKGYRVVEYGPQGARLRRCVHHVVLEAFVGPRPFLSAVARHLDGDRDNNAAANLALGTLSENVRDAIRHGKHGVTRLTPEQVREIRGSEESSDAIASRYGLAKGYVSAIRSKRAWDWV